MEEILLTEALDGDLYIRWKVEEKLTIGINMLQSSEGWHWNSLIWNGKSSTGKNVIIKDNNFVFEDGQIEVNEHFQYLIGSLKTHPTFRLKIINKLDKNYLEIWKTN